MPVKGNKSSRRSFLWFGGSIAALAGFGILSGFFGGRTKVGTPGRVEIAQFSDSGALIGVETVDKVVKDEQAWKDQLSPIAFRVTRQDGTERAFSGPYLDNHEAGIFRCTACETALFGSDAKFESGTGWPSFWQPIAAENIVEHSDWGLGLVRTGLSCARCDSHLGHVFHDGPPPTRLRYCINGVALRFAPFTTA